MKGLFVIKYKMKCNGIGVAVRKIQKGRNGLVVVLSSWVFIASPLD
jgi:hypothetical protein